jgi:hypothetical protein
MHHRRVLFLQLEVFTDCAPHMGMCLFINDLRRQGIDCTAYLVNWEHFEGIFEIIQQGDFGLICLDSTFTIDMVRALTTACPTIPLLLGGVNALALYLHTNASFAVFGPGRRAAREFMAAFFGNRDFSKVTNLFYKNGPHLLYSGRTQLWDLPTELFPYEPCLDWNYLGPTRKAIANTESVSIVAATGCPYAKSTAFTDRYDIGKTVRELGYEPTDTAIRRLDEIYNRKAHGCSFCVFQLQEHRAYTPAKTTEMLLMQAGHLFRTYKTRAFPIQTENPFPFLNEFLQQLLKTGVPLEFVSIRTRPDMLLRHRLKLVEALETAVKHGFHFSIEEIGFESFLEEELILFNKGISVETNFQALKMLRELKEYFKENVSVHVGHGMILFHPWTTLESLAKNLQVMHQYPEIFSRFYAVDLTLYSEFLPIFSKLASENLLVKSNFSYGWHYRPKDPLATAALELYGILFGHFGPDIDISAFINAIRLLEEQSLDEVLAGQFHLFPSRQ